MNCRFCQTELENLFLDLGHSPVSNDFLTPADLEKPETYYPLQVYVCGQCKLVQTRDFRSSEELFKPDYPYFSSVSSSWLAHCRRYTDMMVERFKLTANQYIVEVASNDGYLLQYFLEKGFKVCGIEPTRSTAEAAIKKGIETLIDFFTEDFARHTFTRQKADLIIGNNVLAHVPDLNDFIKGLKIALAPTGIMTFEFPHFWQLYKHNQFDTIYHEHYSYYSFLTINRIFTHHGFHVFDVEEIPTHGGSLRVFVQHKGGPQTECERVKSLLDKEKTAGLNDMAFYASFAEKIEHIKYNLLDFLLQAKRENKQIVAYGAAAKGNTLLNYCGIKNDLIAYCCDANPNKQGLYLPGSHIPVVHPERIAETRPDYILILPWNLQDEITREFSGVSAWGGKFVVAIPELTIL